ncbi:MAG: hypothetical protein ABL893_08975 [Hyphomicrobium sp.]
MAHSVKRAARLAKLLFSLDQLERARLSSTERAIEGVASEQLAILGMFQNDDGQYGQYVDLLSRRIKTLSVKASELEAEKALIEGEIRKSATRCKAAEVALTDARKQFQMQSDLREFTECLELFATQGRGKSGSAS